MGLVLYSFFQHQHPTSIIIPSSLLFPLTLHHQHQYSLIIHHHHHHHHHLHIEEEEEDHQEPQTPSATHRNKKRKEGVPSPTPLQGGCTYEKINLGLFLSIEESCASSSSSPSSEAPSTVSFLQGNQASQSDYLLDPRKLQHA